MSNNTIPEEKSYAYLILDPRKSGTFVYDGGKLILNNLPIYGGKGYGERCNCHVKEAEKYIEQNRSQKWIHKNCINPHKIRKLMKILKAGLEPKIVKMVENVDDQTAINKEIELIWIIGRADLKIGPLTNLTWGGEGSKGGIWSEESRQKLSKTLKSLNRTAWNKGIKMSEEFCEKNSERNRGENNPMYGVERPKKWRDDHSETMKGKQSGEKHWNFGKTHSDESRKKMSDSHTGKIVSEETKKKQGKISKARWASMSPEEKKAHREKISKSKLGHIQSEETKKKMSKNRPECIKISFRGVEYHSTREAARQLSLCVSTMLYLKNNGLEYSSEDEIKEFRRKRRADGAKKGRETRYDKKEK